jgi:hypothetical protein
MLQEQKVHETGSGSVGVTVNPGNRWFIRDMTWNIPTIKANEPLVYELTYTLEREIGTLADVLDWKYEPKKEVHTFTYYNVEMFRKHLEMVKDFFHYQFKPQGLWCLPLPQ